MNSLRFLRSLVLRFRGAGRPLPSVVRCSGGTGEAAFPLTGHLGDGNEAPLALTPRFSGVTQTPRYGRTVPTACTRVAQTVETVAGLITHQYTPLKRGVNENSSRFGGAPSTSAFAVLVFLSGSLLLSTPAQAADTTNGGTSSSRPQFSAFKILSATNIFNTKRRPGFVPSQNTGPVRYSRVDSFALVGVMTYEKGPFAFFEGSSSEFQKVLKPDESIAGFKVGEVTPVSVKLVSPTNELELKVGMQLSRQDGGPWQLGIRPENLDTSGFRAAANWSAQPPARRESESQPQPDGFPGFQGLPDAVVQAIQNNIPGGPQPGVVIQTQTDPNGQNSATSIVVPAPQQNGNGSEGDVLQRLIRRRQEQQNN